MKESIIVWSAAPFRAARFTGHAYASIDDTSMQSGRGFSRGYHHNLNIQGKKGHFTNPPNTYAYSASDGGGGAVIRSSKEITLKRTSTDI